MLDRLVVANTEEDILYTIHDICFVFNFNLKKQSESLVFESILSFINDSWEKKFSKNWTQHLPDQDGTKQVDSLTTKAQSVKLGR